MRRLDLQRFAVVCLLLCAVSVVVFIVGLATCLESECASWHLWVNTVAFFGVPTFLVMAVIAGLTGWVRRD